MIEHLLTYTFFGYSLPDFVPFGAEAYLRLIHRLNESVFPAQFLFTALGIVISWLCWRAKPRAALLLLASTWISTALLFHFMYLSELMWVAPRLGSAFILQAILLAILAFRTPPSGETPPTRKILGQLAFLITFFAYPVSFLLWRGSVTHTEIFGLMPDPTCLATLGALVHLNIKNPFWYIIPFLWITLSTLLNTVLAIHAPAIIFFSSLALIIASFLAGLSKLFQR